MDDGGDLRFLVERGIWPWTFKHRNCKRGPSGWESRPLQQIYGRLASKRESDVGRGREVDVLSERQEPTDRTDVRERNHGVARNLLSADLTDLIDYGQPGI